MSELDVLFSILSVASVLFGLGVVLSRSPIFSALYLVMCMLSVAGIFLTLSAPFVAGVQIILYAGAVMVLFVMVLMLFDLNKEVKVFSRGRGSNFLKIICTAVFLGSVLAAVDITLNDGAVLEASGASRFAINSQPTVAGAADQDQTKQIAQTLFTKYLLHFELIGLLLLVVPIGAVTLSRIQGGTHARS